MDDSKHKLAAEVRSGLAYDRAGAAMAADSNHKPLAATSEGGGQLTEPGERIREHAPTPIRPATSNRLGAVVLMSAIIDTPEGRVTIALERRGLTVDWYAITRELVGLDGDTSTTTTASPSMGRARERWLSSVTQESLR